VRDDRQEMTVKRLRVYEQEVLQSFITIQSQEMWPRSMVTERLSKSHAILATRCAVPSKELLMDKVFREVNENGVP
jgi:hypothetical protein